MPTNPKFYTSRTWRKFREFVITESGGECCRCHRIFCNTSQLEVHHIKYLKGKDYNNPKLAYSKENIEVICHDCHNREHQRFGYQGFKEVVLVFGPPLSGKSSFVKENKNYNDIVVDLDLLQYAISMEPMYSKNIQGGKQVLFKLRDTLLDIIKVRYGSWQKAWIIGGYANSFDRDRLIKNFAVNEVVLMEATKEECLTRLECVKDERHTFKTQWSKFIEDWFKQYTPPLKEKNQIGCQPPA